MGLTDTGYQRPTYDDILNAKIAKAKELFGEDIETGENTALGKYIRINAYDQEQLEETAELIYYSRYPSTATGLSLDRLCPYAGIARNAATKARYTVTVHGTAGYEIPSGFLVSTDAGVTFASIAAVTIEDNGTAEMTVDASTAGEIGNVTVSSINGIVNPDADVTSVEGKSLVTSGTDMESDFALRERFEAAIQGAGSGNENAISASLLRIPTVVSAGVVANYTDVEDDHGRPPRSFECYVVGGEQYHKQIAETIFAKKPVGIKTAGSVSETVIDDGGFEHEIKFSHATNIDVYVKIKIKTDVFYQDDGAAQIKDSVTDYINGLGIAKPLVRSAIYGYIYAVSGVTEVSTLELSTNGTTYTEDNITPQDWEIIRCAEVEVTENAE